jgi:hypothetical protein
MIITRAKPHPSVAFGSKGTIRATCSREMTREQAIAAFTAEVSDWAYVEAVTHYFTKVIKARQPFNKEKVETFTLFATFY